MKLFCFLSAILFLFEGCDYRIHNLAGSYCYSEDYVVENHTDSLIEKINEFKRRNPHYKVLQNGIDEMDEYENYTGLPDDITIHVFNGDTVYEVTSRRTTYTNVQTESSIWYFCYFYFSDIKATICCVVNLRGSSTIIQLTSLTYSSNFVKWKTINKRDEISRKENRKIKKKFETEILDQLGVKWKHKRWWN